MNCDFTCHENVFQDRENRGDLARTMSELEPERPRRRVRYAGKNPRRFEEKYKEHAPERYAAELAKIEARGKTPAGTHRPILVREILEVLAPRAGEVAVDATLGYGGHAQEILGVISPGGRLLALDADAIELPKTEARLRGLGFGLEMLSVHRMNFAGLAQLLAREAPDGADVILADLGVSSMQLDNPARGFTFKADGPLDLRMNPGRGQPAAALLAKLTAPKLERIFHEHADEPHAALLATALFRVQQQRPIVTTAALAAAVRAALSGVPRAVPDDSVRRVFQALRIAVNDEFTALETFLRHLPECLKPGGRVAILTFHSGEDRRVKQAFKTAARDGVFSEIAREVIRPGAEEIRSNPRAASAKLRWARRG